ncbi:MAG: DUF4152 family protein [Candidatus Bathyarchaeia archaeon]
MKIIAADSSSAILNSKFEPAFIVAAAAVLVEPPYKELTTGIFEPIFVKAEGGQEVVVHEAELCKKLLEKVGADAVHLDMSLGAVPLEQLSPIQFSNMKISNKAKRNLIKILPKLRRIANEITQKYGIEVLAIGKDSIPVRIAELTAGAHAILYTCEKTIKENQTVLLGLPSKCQHEIAEGKIFLRSLVMAEHDVKGYAEDTNEVLKKVNMTEMLNPIARGFRTIKITPKL